MAAIVSKQILKLSALHTKEIAYQFIYYEMLMIISSEVRCNHCNNKATGHVLKQQVQNNNHLTQRDVFYVFKKRKPILKTIFKREISRLK